jgi:quinol monooxygenase YgiN
VIVVAGTFRVPPAALTEFRGHMLAMLAASRAEDGCLTYSYAEDVAEPGLIRVFETWRDRAALDAHLQTPHLAAWRASWRQHGAGERDLVVYEVAGVAPFEAAQG